MSTTTSPHPLLDQLNKVGYVVIPKLIDEATVEKLRVACAEVTELARAGNWPYIRTLPKQFPPWPQSTYVNGVWGVQHLMHPDMPHSAEFVSHYFSDELCNVVKELLQCSDEDLVMELFNLLVRPTKDFELRWHRDDVPPEATSEEEMERLAKPGWHAQWNMALYDDASLIVVPGTHARARTEDERNAGPFESNMPGQLIVELGPGDAVFYNNNILHRGKYDPTKERATLHGSMGHVKGGQERARNVLQHGRDWIGEVKLDGLGAEQQERAKGMRSRLVKLAGEVEVTGFSQKD